MSRKKLNLYVVAESSVADPIHYYHEAEGLTLDQVWEILATRKGQKVDFVKGKHRFVRRAERWQDQPQITLGYRNLVKLSDFTSSPAS